MSTDKEQLQDHSVLTDIPCRAPCWQEIKLGETKEQDVINRLQSLEFIGNIDTDATVYITFLGDGIETPHKGIRGMCKQPSDQLCALISLREDKVVAIGLFPNYSITFEEFVQHIGDPDKIIFFQPSESTSQTKAACRIELVWEKKLITASHNVDADLLSQCEIMRKKGQIDPNLEISYISYYERKIDHTARAGDVIFFSWTDFASP